jgi:predicted PurR-regulated permease PerM
MVSSGLFGDSSAVASYINNLAESAMSIAPNAAKPIISGVFTFVMILFLTTFLMIGRRRLEENLKNNLKDKNFRRMMHISEKIESNTRKFILTKLITSSMTGLGIGLGLLLFLSPQDAVIWGSICFVMNFIPIYGSLISGAGAILYTMAVYEHGSFLDAWPVIIIVMFVNNIISNFIEPKLMQFSLPLGSVTVLLAVIIWAWLWGAWGMILAVPITILMKVAMEEVSGKGWVTAIMET